MDNQELIAKLNSLKQINPDQAWLASNRDLLLSQISNSGAENIGLWKAVIINFSSLARTASQPVFALGVFIMLLLSGSLFSRSLFLNAKPNDSLYIARIISEKVKINTTFDSEDRNKLAAQFATEHAQAITTVLADANFNTEANKDQVAKLNSSFKEEVATVQAKMSHLATPAASQPINITNPVLKTKNPVATSDLVVMADSVRDKQGVKLIDNPASKKPELSLPDTVKTDLSASLTAKIASSTKINASSTALVSSSSNTVLDINSNSASQILDEAQKLFDQKNYSQASKKLKEVEEIIK